MTPLAVEDYLAAELTSPVKHEYVGGAIYAMSGGRNRHNLVASNAMIAIGARLRGRPCKVYNSDTKIRIRLPQHIRFYYADLSVVCRPNPPDDTFQDAPVLVVEVLSPSTRRIDEGEKKDAYLTIPGLETYVLVDPDAPAVALYRRTDQGFVREVLEGAGATLALPDLEIELPLSELYEA